MDAVAILTIVLFMVLSFVVRIMLTRWMYQRTARRIITRFAESGAIVEARARTLEELDLSLRRRAIGFRDYRPAVLAELQRSGALIPTEDGRYYLSAEAYQFYNQIRR